jgi:hypothetical protein
MWQLRRSGAWWALLQDGTTVDESDARDPIDALQELSQHCDGAEVHVEDPVRGVMVVQVGRH